jgi:hypothetical protein
MNGLCLMLPLPLPQSSSAHVQVKLWRCGDGREQLLYAPIPSIAVSLPILGHGVAIGARPGPRSTGLLAVDAKPGVGRRFQKADVCDAT